MAPGAGKKVSIPSRNCSLISTGVSIKSEAVHISVSLVDSLASRGLVIAGRSLFEDGEIAVYVANAGREIVEIQDGQEFLDASVIANVQVGSWEVSNEG